MRWPPILLAAALAGCVGSTEERPPSLAEALLRGDHDQIVVDVDAVAGLEPDESVLARIGAAVGSVSGKRVTMTSIGRLPTGLGGADEWSTAELDEAHRIAFETLPAGSDFDGARAVLHVMFVDGDLGGDAVGLQRGHRLYVAAEGLRSIAPLRPVPVHWAPDEIEHSVLLHEVGHAFGLVDHGIPMVSDHENDERPAHSSNPRSVMWPAVDSYDELLRMIGQGEGVPDSFDEDDLADLRAFRSGG